MRLRPYLQLVRLPNLFTAAADSLAGWLLVRGTFAEPGRWVPLMLASTALYAGGLTLNDYFDYATDLRERPGRPLPSGQVGRAFAGGLGAVLLVLGIALAGLGGGGRAWAVAVPLALCVLLYDAGLKATPIGPLVMGACRGLNLALGLSADPGFGGPVGWLAAGSFGLFVAGITWISRAEVETGKTAPVAFGLAVQDLALLGLAAAALGGGRFPGPSSDRPLIPAAGLLVLALVGLVINRAGGRAVVDPRPATVQAAVKAGVLALVWIDVGLVAAVRGPLPALAVAALWVPAFLIGKWLYST
jgi:4-hydroxybenzoate polyprenyltransferase